MAIRADSYGSVAEVVALTRHVLDGQSSFNSTTRPTLTDVETIIDRASAAINVCLAGKGFTSPITTAVNGTAHLMLSDFVVVKAAEYVELTAQSLSGFGVANDERPNVFGQMSGEACEYVDKVTSGLNEIGISLRWTPGVSVKFTGEDAADQRDDPKDPDLRQPRFSRGMFGDLDDKTTVNQT